VRDLLHEQVKLQSSACDVLEAQPAREQLGRSWQNLIARADECRT